MEQFEADEHESKEKEKEKEEAERAKEAEASNRNQRIAEAASSRIFEPLKTYKVKEDLMILARALKTSEDGTNAELTNRIQKHIDENQGTLVNIPRFSGLFATSRRQIKRNLGPRDEPAHLPQRQHAPPSIPTYPNIYHYDAPPEPRLVPFAHTSNLNAGEPGTSSANHRLGQPNSFLLAPSHAYHYYPSYNPYINS